MVLWAVEISKYDIHYVPRRSIKSQALAELSSPIDEDPPLD